MKKPPQSSKGAYKDHPYISIQTQPNHIFIYRCFQILVGSNAAPKHTKIKTLDYLKPMTFTSGKTSDTQCSCAAFVRETFSIYMSLKRLNFYLQHAE